MAYTSYTHSVALMDPSLRYQHHILLDNKYFLGSGSYGIVTKCKDFKTNDVVAVKRIKAERGISSSTLREIVILSQLKHMNHPNVIKIRDVQTTQRGCERFQRELVFECAETDLKKYLYGLKEDLTIPKIKDFMLQILQGMANVHSLNIIHRDMKPQNILIKGNILKIADFGLARSISPSQERLTPDMITRCYRSPEVLLGETRYSYSMDIWSVGCIFAELITRNPLFAGSTDIDQLNAIFKLTGTPHDSNWLEYADLKGGLNIPTYNRINFKYVFPTLGETGVHLLEEMLHCNPRQRPSAVFFINHCFVKPNIIEQHEQQISKSVHLNSIATSSVIEDVPIINRSNNNSSGASSDSGKDRRSNLSCHQASTSSDGIRRDVKFSPLNSAFKSISTTNATTTHPHSLSTLSKSSTATATSSTDIHINCKETQPIHDVSLPIMQPFQNCLLLSTSSPVHKVKNISNNKILQIDSSGRLTLISTLKVLTTSSVTTTTASAQTVPSSAVVPAVQPFKSTKSVQHLKSPLSVQTVISHESKQLNSTQRRLDIPDSFLLHNDFGHQLIECSDSPQSKYDSDSNIDSQDNHSINVSGSSGSGRKRNLFSTTCNEKVHNSHVCEADCQQSLASLCLLDHSCSHTHKKLRMAAVATTERISISQVEVSVVTSQKQQ